MAIGNISPMVSISESRFILGPEQPKILELKALAPENAPYPSFYNGYLRLVFRRL
jgi:hypothetical protein